MGVSALSEGPSGGRSASVDPSGSSMGGALGPDSIPDPVPGAGGTTIKGKHGVVILEDRDDDTVKIRVRGSIDPRLDKFWTFHIIWTLDTSMKLVIRACFSSH